MKVLKLSLCIAVLMAAFCVTTAHAQTFNFNLKSYVTFDQAVQVPGAVLQPNVKYLFRRMDPEAGLNHVVVVMTANDKHVVATFHAISDQHLDAPGKTVFLFYETAAGYARPIREWTYPDRTTGFEFIYPKHQMTEITTHLIDRTNVETQTAQTQPAIRETGEESAALASTNTEETQNDQSEVTREKPSADVDSASSTMNDQNDQQNENSEANAKVEESTPEPTELPRTAGELPLLLVAGFVAIGLRKSLRS